MPPKPWDKLPVQATFVGSAYWWRTVCQWTCQTMMDALPCIWQQLKGSCCLCTFCCTGVTLRTICVQEYNKTYPSCVTCADMLSIQQKLCMNTSAVRSSCCLHSCCVWSEVCPQILASALAQDIPLVDITALHSSTAAKAHAPAAYCFGPASLLCRNWHDPSAHAQTLPGMLGFYQHCKVDVVSSSTTPLVRLCAGMTLMSALQTAGKAHH